VCADGMLCPAVAENIWLFLRGRCWIPNKLGVDRLKSACFARRCRHPSHIFLWDFGDAPSRMTPGSGPSAQYGPTR